MKGTQHYGTRGDTTIDAAYISLARRSRSWVAVPGSSAGGRNSLMRAEVCVWGGGTVGEGVSGSSAGGRNSLMRAEVRGSYSPGRKQLHVRKGTRSRR